MSGPVDVLVLNDLLRAATLYCDREGFENRSNYASGVLERGEKCIAAVGELIEAMKQIAARHSDKSVDGQIARFALANVGPQS